MKIKSVFRRVTLLVFLCISFAKAMGQEIKQQNYKVISTPFTNAVSIAANDTHLVAVTSDEKTYRSTDGITWDQVAKTQSTPANITEHANSIYGVSNQGLVKLKDEKWESLLPASGSLRSQGGLLYNFHTQNEELFVRRSIDGVTWESLPSYPNFKDDVGNLYDLAAYGDNIVVTGHSGRFIRTLDDGTWQIQNVGVGDRLYSAVFYHNTLIFGGTTGDIHISNDFETFTQIQNQPSIRALTSYGGIIIGAGGFNTDRGKIIYSKNTLEWVILEGTPISSIKQIAVLKEKIYFLGITSDISSLAVAEYKKPNISVELTDDEIVINAPRQGEAFYSLQSSTNLTNWDIVEEFTRQDDEGNTTWSVPKRQSEEFFRVEIK